MGRRARSRLTPECSLCLPFRAPRRMAAAGTGGRPPGPPPGGRLAHLPLHQGAGQAKPCVGHKDPAEQGAGNGRNEKNVDLMSNKPGGCRFKNYPDGSQRISPSSHKTKVFWNPLALGPCRSRPWAKAEGCGTAVMVVGGGGLRGQLE